ncbi:putative Ig domain-containing protein [Candidatus Palauibacter scopulicola]|uniref:Ig-like domain-containing protein n=1 Tax=Candidatus Palauibacter scopulicola TaxID=3056741 RepID=UPI0028734FE2|nr:putative Ig domain-containing protein [Candidatus Palauibacter scopulicola]
MTGTARLTAVLVGIAACGGDGMAPPAVPPPPPTPPPPPPQSAPVAVGSIADRTVDAGQTFTVDVSSNFRDPDGDALSYAAASSDEGVAMARAAGSQVNVEAVGPGTASVTVTASDPGGRTAAQSFGVAVRGSFEDDFGSAASLADWTERNNTGISVGGGVLSVTNRTQGRLGIAERTATPTLASWGIQARMGRTTRRASPGVVSVTGHRRFTAARLVLRTIDDSGRSRSGDAARASANYEFALFDRDTREWVRIANMSGRSAEVREAPNEFTDVSFGHEGADFVGYAGAGNAEELFRFDLDDSSVDGVALREVLEYVTGVWLVNQGDAGLTALHDRVEVTGTGSSATAPDVAEVAAALDAAIRSVSVGGPDADRAALVALYEATGGPNWTNNDGWLTDAPVHDWHGVEETDALGRVRALHLDENNLAGELPPEIGNLTALRRLFVSRNRLVGTIPPEIGNLTALESLSAEDNELMGEIPPEIGGLAALRSLWVPRNQLVGAIPPEFGNLAALVTLSLGDNGLTGEIPREFGRLANLDWMNLGGNRLTGEIPPELGTRLPV